MATVEVRVVRYPDVVEHITNSPQGDVMQDLLKRGNRVLNAARRLCPVNTGQLRASLFCEAVTMDGGPAVRIGSNLDYATYVHEGHGPIVPVSAKILAWPGINNSGKGSRRYRGGATSGYVFAHRTRAVAGRPFLLDALDAAR
jgi:hypothetical protein